MNNKTFQRGQHLSADTTLDYGWRQNKKAESSLLITKRRRRDDLIKQQSPFSMESWVDLTDDRKQPFCKGPNQPVGVRCHHFVSAYVVVLIFSRTFDIIQENKLFRSLWQNKDAHFRPVCNSK